MVDLRKQLLQAIERSKLNRKQIADKAGISHSVLYEFCAGKRSLTLNTITKIADVVGIEFRSKRPKKGR